MQKNIFFRRIVCAGRTQICGICLFVLETKIIVRVNILSKFLQIEDAKKNFSFFGNLMPLERVITFCSFNFHTLRLQVNSIYHIWMYVCVYERKKLHEQKKTIKNKLINVLIVLCNCTLTYVAYFPLTLSLYWRTIITIKSCLSAHSQIRVSNLNKFSILIIIIVITIFFFFFFYSLSLCWWYSFRR
jgi:hypothetical protein